MSEPFRLFTSIRYDVALRSLPANGSSENAGWNHRHESPFYMLDYHRDRILRAAVHWQWKAAIDALAGDEALQALAEAAEMFVGPSQTTPLRFKILLDEAGDVQFERYSAAETPLKNLFPKRLPPPEAGVAADDPRKSPQYAVVLDAAVSHKSEHTHFKTTQRDGYDSARTRAHVAPPDQKEVLIINQNNEVMEGTLTTPYFWRGGRWVTPPVPHEFSRVEGSGGQDGTTRRWALERGLVAEEVVLASSLKDGEECWISNGVRGFISGVVSLRAPNS